MAEPARSSLPPALDREAAWPRYARILGALSTSGDARALVLAGLGLLLMQGGWAALDVAFGREPGETLREAVGPGGVPGWDSAAGGPGLVGAMTTGAMAAARPIRVLLGPIAGVFAIGQGNGSFCRSALATLWVLLVWGVAGGTIGRMAALRAGGSIERPRLRTSLRFVLRRTGALVAAPVVPLLLLGPLAAPGAVLGRLDQPGAPEADAVAEVLLGLPLVLSVPMAILLIGVVIGWPLMVLTVVVEGEDAFEAIGRSFGYLAWRPGSFALAVLAAWAGGAAGILIASAFARLVVHLTAWSLAIGGPEDRIGPAFWLGSGPGTAGPPAIGPWSAVVGGLLSAWIFTYAWSAAARIYVLLRQEVDGTPWADLGLPEEDARPFAPGPVPGPDPDDRGDPSSPGNQEGGKPPPLGLESPPAGW
ncbi:hypothetical protein [Tautonia sociabilis]|uniref:Uncharacterized protein n=1 Tax=Tautonia sociabilis TaxID=2080755 RepID=A0A432MIM7_9BACT|nr:hypothetical protein [Tautonia sociabilis]RUL87213.1 hypothetical protein TsocGM_13385 [Tautonia sociabilis]